MDYYGVLGVGKDATKAEIKEAFRNLALKYHPDRHSGSSKSVHDDAVRRFKQVAEAYDVLNDDTKRAKYSNSYSSARSSYNTARASSSSAYYNNHNYNPYSNPNSYYYTKTSTRRHAYTDPRRYTYSAQYSQSVGGFNRLMAMIQLAATFTVFGCYIIADATGRGLWESANRGKSFEEAMYSLHKSKDSRTRMQNETDRAGS